MNDQTTVKQPSKKQESDMKYGHKFKQLRGVLRRLMPLVLFISDCWYFAKRWKPIRISFCPRHKTVFLWRIATKRREAKAAFLEKKKQNVTNEAEENGD